MKTPEEIADYVWDYQGLEHEETMFDHMTWEDFVEWIKSKDKYEKSERFNDNDEIE